MDLATSIVIPALNESSRLLEGYRRLAPTLEEFGVDCTEVIVIDDGSSDDTLRVANHVYGHLPHTLFVQQPTNFGKGAAVRLGIALARGAAVVVADADMAIRPQHLPEMVERLAHCALVPGSRAHDGSIHYDQWLRTHAGDLFHVLVRHYTGTTVRDTQCGAKGFQIGPARVLALLGMINGFAYDAETFYLADRLGLSIEPLAVTWDDVGGSSVRVGRDSWRMIQALRSIPRTRYENPVVELSPDVNAAEIGAHARQARVQGLALARGAANTLLVLPRDGALSGLDIASAFDGVLRTAGLEELRGRVFEAV